MPRAPIETFVTNVDLKPSPIEPAWVISGNPFAEMAVLARSADGSATTIVWQCSEGQFNWYYDFDETVYILEGSVVLESDTMAAKLYGPGDVVFFRNGAHARWHVEGHVRKLAFCRQTQPAWIGFSLKVFAKLRRLILPSQPSKSGSLATSA